VMTARTYAADLETYRLRHRLPRLYALEPAPRKSAWLQTALDALASRTPAGAAVSGYGAPEPRVVAPPLSASATTDDICAICHDPPNAVDSAILPCGHIFCSPCIDRWTKGCPSCRQSFVGATAQRVRVLFTGVA
jgi:hypothetical protein